MRGTVGIAIVGCGFVADFYLATIPNHPELSIIGVYDRDPQRGRAFAARYALGCFPDLDAVLADERVQIAVNLTSPESHYPVSLAALRAGKHVYSEKPLALTHDEGRALVSLAEESGLVLCAAPGSLLGETAQTMWRAVRRGDLGRPHLVYASLDDGALHEMPYKTWRSTSGTPWPYASEFRTGCTLEHAGYYLSWLIAMFGEVAEVSAFAANIGGPVPEVPDPAPDFVSACLRFRSAVVARITCSIIAPSDHSLMIVGDEAVLGTGEAWDYGSPVWIRRAGPPGTPGHLRLAEPESYPLARPADYRHRYPGFHAMDFARGVAEVARLARDGGPARLPARHALHALDVMLAMTAGQRREFAPAAIGPAQPMLWAEDERQTAGALGTDAGRRP
jgi:predicted dehydrogenase